MTMKIQDLTKNTAAAGLVTRQSVRNSSWGGAEDGGRRPAASRPGGGTR